MEKKRSGYHSEFSGFIDRCVSHLLLLSRGKMCALFAKQFQHIESVLDVGVTCDEVNVAANFFEQWFPDKSKITAVGLEDASHLERVYPGLKFVKVQANQKLPFGDRTFSVVFSNAVVEHVTAPQDRKFFLNELYRVADRIFVTTPNRYYPVEPHTGIPLLHVLSPKLFYFLLDRGYLSKFYRSTNLQLLSAGEFRDLMKDLGIPGEIHHVKTYGVPSNLIFISAPRVIGRDAGIKQTVIKHQLTNSEPARI